MSQVVVEPVAGRQQQKAFLRLPWELYRDDPNWIPPLRRNQQALLGFRSHPFHRQGRVQCFLARQSGRPVGRIAAIVNDEHNRLYAERRGFFGFFESIDGTAVAKALFEAASAWLREQQMDSVRGPANPSMNYECGLLVEGFDSPPTFMMTYNPPHYERLIEECGFEKSQDLLAFVGKVAMLSGLDPKLAFVVEEARRRFDVQLRTLDRSRFHEDVRLFLDIYNRSNMGSWGFVPLSEAELEYLGKDLKQLIVPEMTAIAEVEGKPIGAVFGLLDYNPRIKKIDGRLFPLGFLHLLWNRRGIKRVRLISTNVVPEYQKWGIGLVLHNHLLPGVLRYGIEEGEFSWVLESNRLSRQTLERGGAERTKLYRMYDRELAP